jgi:hypothetical protein
MAAMPPSPPPERRNETPVALEHRLNWEIQQLRWMVEHLQEENARLRAKYEDAINGPNG